MSPVVVSPMPQEFALAHAARVAFFHEGCTTPKLRRELISRFAEARCIGAGSIPLLGQLATISGISVTDYARQHSLLPVLRVAENTITPALHGNAENPRITQLVGARMHIDKIHLCRKCVQNDLSHWSFSWFRRTHNLAGIETCAVHGEPLHWVTAADPLSRLPQHWVESEAIEEVEFDRTSKSQSLFQARLQEMYDIFLERDRPFELFRVRGALFERAQELGLRISSSSSSSTRGTMPTVSDYVLEHAPAAWIRKHWPSLDAKPKGAFFEAIDRLVTSQATPGTGFAYAVTFSMIFDAAEDASRALAGSVALPRKRSDLSAKTRYTPEFWQTEYIDAFVALEGNISAIAKHLGLDRRYVTHKTKSLGLPTAKGGLLSPPWRALQRFGSGEGLAEACAVEGVEVKLVESLLRTTSASLVRALDTAIDRKKSVLRCPPTLNSECVT